LQKANNFSRLGHASSLFLREDLLSVEVHVEGTWTSHFDVGGDFQLTLDVFLQAPGLSFDVASHEAAFDVD
jgi:hypothetical protein